MNRAHLQSVPVDSPPAELTFTDAATGLETRVLRAGRGDRVVVLNGLLGVNKHWWGSVSCLVPACDCAVVEPPLLKLEGAHCSVTGVVRIVTELLDRLGPAPAVLMGNSLGGHVAMRIALERPELVRGLVLVGSSGLFERTFERGVMHTPSKEWLRGKIEGLFHDPGVMPEGMVDEAYEALRHRRAARALVKLGKSAKNDHLGDELSRISVPTLLAWGAQDAVTPPDVAREFHSLIRGSRLSWIEGCGHAPQVEKPGELARLVADFVRGLGTGGGACGGVGA